MYIYTHHHDMDMQHDPGTLYILYVLEFFGIILGLNCKKLMRNEDSNVANPKMIWSTRTTIIMSRPV